MKVTTRRKDVFQVVQVTLIDQEYVADDRLQRLAETQCDGGTDADFEAFANDVYGDLASGICGTRGGGEANSLGLNLVECQHQKCKGQVWEIYDLSISVLHQFLPRYEIVDRERESEILA